MMTPTNDRVSIDVWSDIMCPFCYMGDTLLLQAVGAFEHPVEITYHSYQLMPDLPEGEAANASELLAKKYGTSLAEAEGMNAQVSERAAQVGLTYRLDQAIATNTRAAHRLIHFAATAGKQHAMVERLFKAYFTEGLNTGDYGTLADLAAETGLDRAQAMSALESGAFSDAVDADIQEARQLGINGVPFFVFDSAYAVSGAQPLEVFTKTLHAAWDAKQG